VRGLIIKEKTSIFSRQDKHLIVIMLFKYTFILAIVLVSCSKRTDLNPACSTDELLTSFLTDDGIEVFIYNNGELYASSGETCEFQFQYFDPQELENAYQINNDGRFLVSGSDLFPVKNDYSDDFESIPVFNNMIVQSLTDTHLFWTSFTLQSPSVPNVADYNALRACILDGSCTFIDNKIELAPDPVNSTNSTLKFTSVAPTSSMVTAKASLSSTLNYFVKDMDVWFQAEFYIESGQPFSLVDFESSYFESSPGPRVVIRNGKLEIENKFGTKANYSNTGNTLVPSNQWFNVKVHLKYSDTTNGIIELWQDGIKLINAVGITLPLPIAVQNTLEVGISATPETCIMYMDNLRISESQF